MATIERDDMLNRRQHIKQKIGLGCSRLGSLANTSASSPVDLLNDAYDMGIRYFDTADIYAQGDSERWLGEVLEAREDVRICTKVGQYFPRHLRMLLPVKAQVRSLVQRFPALNSGVRSVRAAPLPVNYSPDYIEGAVSASLKRLRRSNIDTIMLHGVQRHSIGTNEAIQTLGKLRLAGKLKNVGVSCDDLESAKAMISHPGVNVIQFAVHGIGNEALELAKEVHDTGKEFVAREIFHSIDKSDPNARIGMRRILSELTSMDFVAYSLIGTTKSQHLKELLEP